MDQHPTPRHCDGPNQPYLWRAGDTAQGVALQHGISQSQLAAANQSLDLAQLLPGAPICIPPRLPQCPNGVLHSVRRGDTVSSIARAHGITAGALMDSNPYLDPNQLQIGMLLCVPPGESAQPQPSPACPPGYSSGTVRYGETCGDILLRYNISYQAFRLANPQLDPARLLPGQRHCIPPTDSRGLCAPGTASHVLDPGENLLSLAARLHTTPESLLRQNPNLAPADFIPGRTVCL